MATRKKTAVRTKKAAAVTTKTAKKKTSKAVATKTAPTPRPRAAVKKATRATPAAKAVRVTKASARAFVSAARLPAIPKTPRRRDATPAQFLDDAEQAAVVGSGLVSFTAGVPAQRREDLCNATLLAQLSANRKVPDRSNILAWFDAYFTALMNLGWVVQQTGFREYAGEFDGLETHEAVRQVAAVLLAPNPAVLAVLGATLDAMQAMDRKQPWITIFDREHRDTKTTHFRSRSRTSCRTAVWWMHLLAFSLQASAKLTQVLFFKLKKKRVKLQQNSGQAVVDVGVLGSVREALKKKLAERVTDFIATVDI